MKIKVISNKEILDKLEKLAGFTPERAEKNKGWKLWIGKEAAGRFQKQGGGCGGVEGGNGQVLAELRVREERDLGAVTLCEGYWER